MCNPASNYWPGTAKRPGQNVQLKSRDGGDFTVHVSRPEGDGPYPTMLIIHDYFDPDDYYFDLADQYAAAGYLAVCPDLFHRQGDLSEQTHEKAGARIGSVGDDQAMEDLDVVLEHIRGEGLVGDLAITGFCWGGRVAYLFAARHRETRALVVMYGHLSAWSGPEGNKPYSPLDEAAKIDARVIGSYGGGDESIPLDQVRDMEKRLQEHGVSAELKVYDGAPHCFFRTPEWKEASDDVWSRVLSGLKEAMA
ncbi:MAG TPA: dienelactone hydrolase family protein [Candidatus Dormibacteraeota bacterium]|nr:dienelactone hydrolase family protein [Candidatus Dormibacteraeota bacterium]